MEASTRQEIRNLRMEGRQVQVAKSSSLWYTDVAGGEAMAKNAGTCIQA